MTHSTGETTDHKPGIEMPKPTVWPMVLALAITLIAAAAALGAWAFAVIGGLLFVVSFCGWMGALLPGRGHESEPLTHPLPTTITGRTGTVEHLQPGMTGYRFRLPEKVHPISAGLKGGVVGGIVMTFPALAWGVLSGHGLWFPVNLLAGLALPSVDDLSVPELEQFRMGLFLIGLVIHVVMSATIGLIYGVMLPTIPGAVKWQIIIGGIVLPLVWTGVSHGMMGIANPVLQHYVDWFWFAISQLIFGLAAAIVVVRSEKIAVMPAGSGTAGERA
ncbi:MAG: hypothetical protein C0467_08150 [Planctomycetaceae bacterium]|nr:hypothetical protein [Planctomycetaceae bacterium]